MERARPHSDYRETADHRGAAALAVQFRCPQSGFTGLKSAYTCAGMRFALLGLSLLSYFFIPMLTSRSAFAREEGTSLEYQVKGAYLYYFAKFIDWPPKTFANPDSPIELCMQGQSPFQPDFEVELRSKKVHDRNIEIRHVQDVEEASACQILFLPASEKSRLRDLISALKGKSILLVGETSDFNRLGGMIQFVLEGGTVRFKINLPSAQQSGLQISSKLLEVAIREESK